MSQARNQARHEIKLQLVALAVAGACATMSGAAFAQAQDAAGAPATSDVAGPAGVSAVNTVTVTGIRASMQSTLNLKRNSDGIVDGIVADDIGKFPDTNLAEAVQRISGVSIDRSNGEGQRVTVRGVGPDFNLVLLNGRQMPSANLDDRGSRSFDFSNLASEAISQIQVYKSQRADTPAGGVGATLNIMTGRPLDLGNQTSIGAKIDYDKSNMNLPDQLAGKKFTPEVSFLVSRKFGDNDMFGVSLTGSYQSRNSGSAQAQIPNGYLGPTLGPNAGSLTGSKGINNLGATQLFDTPQNLSYSLNGTQRQRTNSQLTFQFRPTKDWTSTLDYTYARTKVQNNDNSLNVWFSGKNAVSGVDFKDGPVQSPTSYTETYGTGGNAQDLDMVSNRGATVSTLKSLGFNTQYRVNSGLKFSFDIHHSTSEAGADSPYGTATDLSVASFGRNANTVDLTQEMPVLSVDYTPNPFQVSGSWFQDAAVKQTVDQAQAAGSLKIGESSNLNFGLGHIKTKMNSAFQQVEQDSWTGTILNRAATSTYFDQSNFTPINYTQYFSKLGGSGSANLFPTMWLVNFPAVRQDVINATSQTNNPDVVSIDPSKFSPSLSNPSEVRALQEKTNSIYGQFNTDWDTALPMHTGVGLRYEKTTVDTTFTIAYPGSEGWISQNEFPITLNPGVQQSQSADYHFWLPTLDWDMDLTSNLKLRASWGVSIGRPRWDQIQGGTSYGGGNASIRGETGTAGNPALLPVKSKNLDLSAEWYYSKHSMVSLGLFNKDLSGYAGTTIQNQSSTTATTPVGGAYWNAAVANGNCGTDTFCIRDYIFSHFNGQPGVTSTGIGPDGVHLAGNIVGQPGDPALPLLITTTTNANNSNVKGAEINWQHMFDNGFGFQANYTYVKSDLHYDTASANTTQFAMVGLANSANLVGIYENDKLSVRLAYNWRGEFLNSLAAFNQPEPGFTEAYGQVDLSVGYNINKNLSVSLEGINLTNSTQRIHARDSNEVLSAVQFGPRYMIGARYKF